MAYQSFEDLEVWQRGCRLSVAIFNAFKTCKRFTLRHQIERAGLSIPSNIAEGAERGSSKDFAHFLNFSKGSCAELRTQLYIARKLNAVNKSAFDSLLRESREISAMLQGLRSSVLRKALPKQKRARRRLKLKT
jgi:four helix bundle protein